MRGQGTDAREAWQLMVFSNRVAPGLRSPPELGEVTMRVRITCNLA